ncbi:MAG: winged helix DNA-binding protein [Bacteroidales bacterium]|jgi:DNA-binding MarR family transcriptional regulator|nr:winged helix DNA-binding protein [Bacteroidales bacterium]
MKKSEILTAIISHFFAFDEERGNKEQYQIEDFIGYLSGKSASRDMAMREIAGDKQGFLMDKYDNATRDIAVLITLMNHYAKWYIKKVLKDSSLQTPDEFSFLITLMTYDSLSKSELITKQVMEKTSGTEIIRRLVRRGLMVETADDRDRRSKRVSISAAGREEILRLLPRMGKVTDIVVGNLNPEEINTLAYLLKKLDYFHNNIYLNKKGASFSDIVLGIKGTTA